MKVNLNIRHTEMIIPPRCRKPRPEEKESQISVHIREISKDSAPIAFLVKEFDRQVREVRLFNGRLYKQYQDRQKRHEARNVREYESNLLWKNQRAEQVQWQSLLVFNSGNFCRGRKPYWDYGTLQANVESSRKAAKEYIIVDGYVYQRTGEPYYHIECFGLGHNHGGTGLFVKWSDYSRKAVFGYSPLDKGAAIRAAVEIATNRGDTDDIERLQACDYYDIQVVIHTAVKRKYERI